MNFFIEQFDNSISKSLNDELLFEEKGNGEIFPFPLDESTIPIIKEEKSSFPKNMFITKKTIKEKIKHQKLILENKNNLNNIPKKEIYFNKKEDLKRRNRESAQRSRDKKKLEFKQIIEENKKLKDELYLINCKINLLCSGCRSIFNIKNNEDIEEDKNNNNICVNCFSNNDNENDNIDINNNIFNIPSTNASFLNLKIQKVFNFILIGTLTLLCIFGIVSNISNNNNINEEEQITKLKIKENILNNNISNIHDYFLKKGNYNDSNNSNTNNNNQENNGNFNKIEFNNNVCIKDSFSSFQCQKKSFNELYDEEPNEKNYYNLEINKDNFMHHNHSKSIYFKLFVQSCSKDENYTNQNIDNDKTHLIFSSDNNKYQDFYFYCQRTEN